MRLKEMSRMICEIESFGVKRVHTILVAYRWSIRLVWSVEIRIVYVIANE